MLFIAEWLTAGRHPEPLSDEYKADILFADGGESFVSSSHHISRSELNAASSLNDGSVIEGRSGFDLDAVGMVVMFQCILVFVRETGVWHFIPCFADM